MRAGLGLAYCLLAVGVIAMVLLRDESPTAVQPVPAPLIQEPAVDAASTESAQTFASALPAEKPDVTAASPRAELNNETLRSCLGNTPVESLPEVIDDVNRLEPYMIRHESMSAYRLQDDSRLQSVANFGDSKATAVLALLSRDIGPEIEL
ncbi:MAG: hypothetical protein AAGI27_08570 [Pseudomonadota bacterium]